MKKMLKRPCIRLVSVLLLLSTLLFCLCLNVSAAENIVVLDNCDKSNGWNGGVKKDNAEITEGEGSLKYTIKPESEAFIIYKSYSTSFDASGENCLEFDLWLDDAILIESSSFFAVEISSSGTWDNEEIEWNDELKYYEYGNGWTHIVLPFKESTINLSKINFFRIFMLDIAVDNEITIRLDNICFTNRDDIAASEPGNKNDNQQIVNLAETAAPETVAVPETTVTKETTSETESQTEEANNALSLKIPLIIAGAAVIVIGVALLVFGIIKKRRLFSIIGAVAVLLGATALIIGLIQNTSDADPDKDEMVTTEAVTEPERDPNDITTIYFKDSIDSTLPNVVLGETVIENGLSATNGIGEPYTMEISDNPCWIFEYSRKETTNNFFYIDTDDKTKEEYSGRNIAIGFVYYITENTKITINYIKTDGSIAEVVKNMSNNNEKWVKMNINLPDCAFTGGVDGHDIKVTSENAELFRVNTVYLREAIAASVEGTQLVIPKYECGEYIVAEYNIMSFGAVGDGKTDDTTAIKSAINYAASHSGGTIFMPAGKYCVTDTFELPTSVFLVGELETGTANGTVIYAYCGKGSASGSALFKMQHGSSLRNIAIYYPEQRFVNGAPIPYPYTIEQIGTEGLDIENVTLVNSYNGIDFSTGGDSLQTVRNLNGTILNIGYHMNSCWDIGRLENVYFSPKFWLECGLESVPIREELENYMLTNSVGLIIERIDWTYFSDVRVEGYNIGMLARASADGALNGHMYNFQLVDCFNPLVLRDVSGIGIISTNCEFSAVGGKGAIAVLCESSFNSDICFNSCTIKSEGDYAIVNNGSGTISAVDSKVSSASDTTYLSASGSHSFINTDIPGENVITEDTVKLNTSYDYNRYVYTKPASETFIDMSREPYLVKSGNDITKDLQAAIDSLKGTGGMIYLPAGDYYVEDAITVHAGIELRGPADMPHNIAVKTATICTDFGRNNPDGEALLTFMDGSGIRGINFSYYNQKTANITPYSFTIRGNGSDIYVCNLQMPSAYNGVDFATYRCDRHYVEYIWGTPIYRGVVVGAGSEDGIIRDIQYTPNTWMGEGIEWGESHGYIMANSEPFVIGESKRQILYHNFTYGGWRGLTVKEGASDAFIIAHGVDSGNFSAYFEGNCTAQLVNTQLVNLNGKEMNYVYTSEDFTGNVTMLNTNMWGTTKNAIIKQGPGTLTMIGGEVLESGTNMLTISGGDMTLAGIHNRQKNLRADLMVKEGTNSLTAYGNIFTSGGKVKVEDAVSPEKLHGAIFNQEK